MDARLVNAVRIANREFQDFIDAVANDGPNIAKSAEAVRRLRKIARRLSQVDRYLAHPKASPATPDSEHEILQYRENLKALKKAIETLQYALLAEKSQIENTRANMKSASAWAHSLRQTS